MDKVLKEKLISEIAQKQRIPIEVSRKFVEAKGKLKNKLQFSQERKS